jgi:hypothetical protein
MGRSRTLAAAALAATLAGCGDESGGQMPGRPTGLTWAPMQAGTSLSFQAPRRTGQSAISTFVATCTADAEILSGRHHSSPVQVAGMRHGVRYTCSVNASNSAGTGAASDPVTVMLAAPERASLEAGYRLARWAPGMSVTYTSGCTMTVWPNDRPNHAVDAFYLAPPVKSSALSSPVATTPVSGIKLVVTPYEGAGAQAPVSFNICPTKALSTTPVNAGAIGILISGSALYRASEIPGHRATVLKDKVSYQPRRAGQPADAVHFIDACNGHPTPRTAGNSYHYHGLSDCVTAQVDKAGGPSHLIGVALDGFPIYGDRDLQGQRVNPGQLDACNGITSATPEFPAGVYHYVLPQGVQQFNASLRCFAGTVPQQQLAAAEANGFCYSASDAAGESSSGKRMAVGGRH